MIYFRHASGAKGSFFIIHGWVFACPSLGALWLRFMSDLLREQFFQPVLLDALDRAGGPSIQPALHLPDGDDVLGLGRFYADLQTGSWAKVHLGESAAAKLRHGEYGRLIQTGSRNLNGVFQALTVDE
jgi:hypothetical protein